MVNIQDDQCQHAYNLAKCAVIDVHKAIYLQAESPADCKKIMQQVLVDIFNNWLKEGVSFTDLDLSIRTKVFVFGLVTNVCQLIHAVGTCGLDAE